MEGDYSAYRTEGDHRSCRARKTLSAGSEISLLGPSDADGPGGATIRCLTSAWVRRQSAAAQLGGQVGRGGARRARRGNHCAVRSRMEEVGCMVRR